MLGGICSEEDCATACRTVLNIVLLYPETTAILNLETTAILNLEMSMPSGVESPVILGIKEIL